MRGTMIAFEHGIMSTETPWWYRRTFMLAIAIAPFIAGIIALAAGRGCSIWVYTELGRFYPIIIHDKHQPDVSDVVSEAPQ